MQEHSPYSIQGLLWLYNGNVACTKEGGFCPSLVTLLSVSGRATSVLVASDVQGMVPGGEM